MLINCVLKFEILQIFEMERVKLYHYNKTSVSGRCGTYCDILEIFTDSCVLVHSTTPEI